MKPILYISLCFLCSLFIFHPVLIAQELDESNGLKVFVGDWQSDNDDQVSKGVGFGWNIIQLENFLPTYKIGETKIQNIVYIQYIPRDKTYEVYRFFTSGYADSGHVWVDGDTWTFVFEDRQGAKKGNKGARFKLVGVFSENSYQYKFYTSSKGGPWEPSVEGSMTKITNE